jgi:hypothetical protein
MPRPANNPIRDRFARELRSPNLGGWSLKPPPYLLGLAEEDFARLKARWLQKVMQTTELVPSHRVAAYFVYDHLNWCTMDCWPAMKRLAALVGGVEKTIQRAIAALELAQLLAVWRFHGSRFPMRYAPIYLFERALLVKPVPLNGHGGPRQLDTDVHQSSLVTPLTSLLPAQQDGSTESAPATFNLRQRGTIERDVARLVGGYDNLCRLSAIDDQIVTRLCEAHLMGVLGKRQIEATKLAASQCRFR